MKGRSENPKNWPSSVVYITKCVYSKKLSPETLAQLTTGNIPQNPQQQQNAPGGVSKLIRIKLITDKGHPACGQYGLFSSCKLTAKSHILDYMGYVHPDFESDPTSDYDISLDSGLEIAIDAQRIDNEGRMVNDYRGIGDRPNVMFDDHIVNGERRMGIYVMAKDIAKGEELLVSYGKGFWKARIN